MRKYDDPVDVRRGRVRGVEAPEEFTWHDGSWQVREVVAHWVETGAWWRSVARQAGGETGPSTPSAPSDGLPGRSSGVTDLLDEREMWRVVARRGGEGSYGTYGSPGVFDLEFSWSQGNWRLAGCLD